MTRKQLVILVIIGLLSGGWRWGPVRQDNGEMVKQLCNGEVCCETTKGKQKLPDSKTDLFTVTVCRTLGAFEDPTRRLHITVQSLRFTQVVGTTILLWHFKLWYLLPTIPILIDYGIYEFILEPWSKARVSEGKSSLQGNYWETGPQVGERFVIP